MLRKLEKRVNQFIKLIIFLSDSMTMQLELANSILTTYKMVDSAIQRLTESDMQEFNIQDVLKLPLSESYKLLL